MGRLKEQIGLGLAPSEEVPAKTPLPLILAGAGSSVPLDHGPRAEMSNIHTLLQDFGIWLSVLERRFVPATDILIPFAPALTVPQPASTSHMSSSGAQPQPIALPSHPE